jgi:hypothetical protein
MEGNCAAGPEVSGRCADQCDRVALVDQDIATDSQIAVSGASHFGGIAFHELDIGVTSGARALARRGDPGSVAVDPDDGPGRSDHFRREHCHVARSAIEIDDAHALCEPNLAQEARRDRAEVVRLQHQPAKFPVRMPQDIILDQTSLLVLRLIRVPMQPGCADSLYNKKVPTRRLAPTDIGLQL